MVRIVFVSGSFNVGVFGEMVSVVFDVLDVGDVSVEIVGEEEVIS